MNTYGSQIWPYSKNCPSKFYISWRKAIRRLWKIPCRTHNKFIHIINKLYAHLSAIGKQVAIMSMVIR